MQTSASVAHWRQSRGALKQSWSTTGQFPAYQLTQEHEAYRSRSAHAPFTYLAAFAFILPAFASSLSAPILAAIVLVALLRWVDARMAFVVSGLVLAVISPEHDWVFDVATGAIWGIVVALQSRGRFARGSSVTPPFIQS